MMFNYCLTPNVENVDPLQAYCDDFVWMVKSLWSEKNSEI